MFYLLYEDDGPLGICGQAMSITSNWKRLYKIRKYEDVRNICERILKLDNRKNPTITKIFTDNEQDEFEYSCELILEIKGDLCH